MADPVRLRLSRAKGFDLQALSRATNGLPAVSITRGPGRKWGNPWIAGEPFYPAAATVVARFRAAVIGPVLDGRQCKPNWHPESYIGRIAKLAPIELRGKNLACACRLDAPCHADVLLELANRPICEDA